MGDTLYYGYDGKRVGALKKMLSDVVSIEKDWLITTNKMFGQQGYGKFLKMVKHWVREEHGEELTDAQAWLLIHALTNEGVPNSLRDSLNDEKVSPAKYVAGSAVGLFDKAVDGTVGSVRAAGKAVTHMTKPFSSDNTEE
jgi:hypothetical protein